MIDVIVICEGRTEETFVRDLLSVPFAANRILLQPRLIRTSRSGSGGALSGDRVLRYLRNTLRQRAGTYVTTLFDLYGLRADFPGRAETEGMNDPIARAAAIEERLAEAVVDAAQCRPDRFIAHIQPYEFESLLFSEIGRLAEVEPEWQAFIASLEAARAAAQSPEHINDGQDTHPSARLQRLLRPPYQKILHGTSAVARIGIDRIRAECHHFGTWLSRIETLEHLRTEA